MKKKIIELSPISTNFEEIELIEKELKILIKEEIFYPLLLEIGEKKNKLSNAQETALEAALRYNRLSYLKGAFHGKLNAAISKELKKIGAKWNDKLKRFEMPLKEIPKNIKDLIESADKRFNEKLAALDKKLQKLLPEKIADKFNVKNLFDRTIYKVDENFRKNVKSIRLIPEITKGETDSIYKGYETNMRLAIKGFTDEEIKALRQKVKASFFKGNRYESLIKTIQKSYDITEKRAKFIARQETNLILSKFKETRLKEAGIMFYRWQTVVGSPAHPVRPTHREVNGCIFTWDHNKEVDQKGNIKPNGKTKPGKNNDCNPKEDFRCRCTAIPLWVNVSATGTKK